MTFLKQLQFERKFKIQLTFSSDVRINAIHALFDIVILIQLATEESAANVKS